MNTTVFRYDAARLTALMTIITFGIAIFTPPISGANCRDNCIEYPYLDIESRFPRDYYWMYAAILLMLIYVALMVCVHHYAATDHKVFSHIGLSFAIMAAAVLIIDYFVQISVIQPSLSNGETEGITILTQYDPNGIFIALEELGYGMMSLAFLCIAPVFAGNNRVERALRWLFVGGFVLTIVAFIGVSLAYGIDHQDRFEVMVISINWMVLLIAGGLMSRVFKQAMAVE